MMEPGAASWQALRPSFGAATSAASPRPHTALPHGHAHHARPGPHQQQQAEAAQQLHAAPSSLHGGGGPGSSNSTNAAAPYSSQFLQAAASLLRAGEPTAAAGSDGEGFVGTLGSMGARGGAGERHARAVVPAPTASWGRSSSGDGDSAGERLRGLRGLHD